ncbi:Chaperone protein [Frankliniella fusca]|uniref:Chaperone protein n=1 Tax=Frankliniella fusca TaxID=407009 RepID=A0AAE1HK67_9NEOP|nr:Chaperone protein [Frankliniella fusca]
MAMGEPKTEKTSVTKTCAISAEDFVFRGMAKGQPENASTATKTEANKRSSVVTGAADKPKLNLVHSRCRAGRPKSSGRITAVFGMSLSWIKRGAEMQGVTPVITMTSGSRDAMWVVTGRDTNPSVTPFTRNFERGKDDPRRPILTIVITAPESTTELQFKLLIVHFTMGLPGVGKSCGPKGTFAEVLTTLDAATSSFPV